ncbi:MAG: nucleoside-diphosphate sugar epimerase/dehydratase [Pseudomonadota bacterium]
MMKSSWRSALAFGHDLAAAALAWWAAYLLRFNLDVPLEFHGDMLRSLALVVPLQAVFFSGFGLYRGIWRYASLPDLKRILLAVLFSAIAVATLLFMLRMPIVVPRSVLILDPILLLLLMGGSRVAYRVWKERGLRGWNATQPVVVLGAGDAAVGLLKDLERSREWRVVALFDDDANKRGKQLQGIKVYGSIDELPQWYEKLGVQHAIIAMPSAAHGVRRHAMEICAQCSLKVMTVPSFDDLISGKVTVSQIRQVELDDLLGRDPVVLDTAGLHQLLDGSTVLVSGAGGSIGSELCRQVVKFRPRLLVLFELNEFSLYAIEQEFRERFPDIDIACVIGDVKNRVRVQQVFAQYRPQVVFHAAAYKHVPLMENANAWEAVRNNVLGTYTLAQAAIDVAVEKFVLISTDKAVNPTNVMGASKRLAEMVCQSLQRQGSTRFIMVRFGNVLGSTGSVIPKFREQIARGGPVTVTHPDITRYFMSIPEAAQLVMQAGLMGQGGEIFVLDMGEPVKIADLARDMIRLSGFSEDDIRIEYTGLRPGEKLYEELLADGEHTLPTPHAKLRIAQARAADGAWLQALLAWLSAEDLLDDAAVKQGLRRWVPEYNPAPHDVPRL